MHLAAAAAAGGGGGPHLPVNSIGVERPRDASRLVHSA